MMATFLSDIAQHVMTVGQNAVWRSKSIYIFTICYCVDK